jgi:hypothetical protein
MQATGEKQIQATQQAQDDGNVNRGRKEAKE